MVGNTIWSPSLQSSCCSDMDDAMPVPDASLLLAHTVLNYDVKMENEGGRPPDLWFASVCIPDRKAKVMFRKRAR